MIEVAGIDHVVLRTSRLAEMLNFYVHVLGCAVERESSAETGLVQLRAGSALIDLVTVDGHLGRKGGGAPSLTENNMDHFCLQIKPALESDIIQYLSENGIEATDFAERYGAQGFGRSTHIKDPEQNTIELRVQL